MLFRIIDVNSNRVREATRVIEDYARFVLEDSELYRQIRSIRHNLIHILERVGYNRLLSARDIENDYGRDNPGGSKNIAGIIISNLRRMSEALRSISEYLKSEYPSLVSQVEKLRFETYQLEQRFYYVLYPKQSLDKVRLYVLVTENDIPAIPSLIGSGADMIQLRAKHAEDRQLLQYARKIRRIIKSQISNPKSQILFIVNNRVDIALLSNADGVHLGETDISVRDARRILGPDKIIGATSHNIQEVQQAEKDGADYISVGPFFPSPTKPLLKPKGFEYIKDIAGKIHIPYIAIGGITTNNLPLLLKTHKKFFKSPLKIAVSSAILQSGDVYKETKHFKSFLR